MVQLMADEPRLQVPKQLVEAFPAQRHQCAQALVLTGATTSNMEAARAGMTLEAFMDWRAANRD